MDEAIAAWRRIVSKYPDTDDASQAQYAIAKTLETKLGKLEDALEEYRKTAKGSRAADAQQAIARLTATSMTVATERVFRSDEMPKLKLVSRNVESVTVRAYKVDMQTYFRKMHLCPGRRGARHLADRSRHDVRVQGARLHEASGDGESRRGAAARRGEDGRDGGHH